jgi:restriction system protein
MDGLKSLPKTDAKRGRGDTDLSRPLIMLCPECGSRMVRRTAKKGLGTGSQFWGCSAFPKCKVIKPIK